MQNLQKNKTCYQEKKPITPLVVVIGLILFAVPSFAESEPVSEDEITTIEIKSSKIIVIEDSTAFGEVLKVEEASAQLESVSEVLSDAVGVQIRSLGGLGSYGAASIRGSTPN